MAIRLVSGNLESGTVDGNATQTYKLKFQVDANTNADERQYDLKVNGCGGKVMSVAVKQKGKNIVIEDFDYLILNYEWGDCNGQDFDSATAFINSGVSLLDHVYLGFYMPVFINAIYFIDENGGHKMTESAEYAKWSADPYNWEHGDNLDNMLFVWGGDNQQSGGENVLINVRKLREKFGQIIPNETYIRVLGNWYGPKGGGVNSGAVKVNMKAYKGGEPVREGRFGFKIQGNTVVKHEGSVLVDVTAQGTTNYENYESKYSEVATITYRKSDNSALITTPNETTKSVDC